MREPARAHAHSAWQALAICRTARGGAMPRCLEWHRVCYRFTTPLLCSPLVEETRMAQGSKSVAWLNLAFGTLN
ncbi:MAG: hypothetical protein ACYCUX_06185, partial [Metallibacterium sp.]